jgi:hypothetical protein
MKPRSNHIRSKRSLLSSRPARLPAASDAGRNESVVPVVRKPSRGKWLIVVSALVGVVAFVGTWAFFELVVWARVPPELVGKWVVREGPQEGATFDFYRGGTMVGRVNAGGNEAIVNARIRVEDKTIYSTTTNPHTGRDDTMALKIRALTARELVVEDQQRQLLKMERAE